MCARIARTMTALAFLFILLVPAAARAAYDHSRIEGPFGSGPEVTKVCLKCHEQGQGSRGSVHEPAAQGVPAAGG